MFSLRKQNVGRLHITPDLDPQRTDAASLASLDHTSLVNSPASLSNSSLPDVVQQEVHSTGGNSTARNQTPITKIPQEFSSLSSDTNADILKAVVGHPGTHVPDGSSQSMAALTTLAQLQDPATFTIGSPDSKKKNKVTKANFGQNQGSLQTGVGWLG